MAHIYIFAITHRHTRTVVCWKVVSIAYLIFLKTYAPWVWVLFTTSSDLESFPYLPRTSPPAQAHQPHIYLKSIIWHSAAAILGVVFSTKETLVGHEHECLTQRGELGAELCSDSQLQSSNAVPQLQDTGWALWERFQNGRPWGPTFCSQQILFFFNRWMTTGPTYLLQ